MYPKTFGKFIEPRVVVSHFHLREGDSIADFGAGSGHYMKPLSEVVGQSGKVYLCEIQKNIVETLGIMIHEARLRNVRTLWCDLEAPHGIKLQNGTLDAGLLSNTLFQFSDKRAGLTEIARTIRKGGKLFVIDWSDSFGGLGPRRDQLVSENDARTLVESIGFSIERTFPAGDHHYGLACRKN